MEEQTIDFEVDINQARQGLIKLAYGKVCDAVKLMYFSEDNDLAILDSYDLFNVSKFKKTKDGFEIEVFDRQKAIEALSNMENSSKLNTGIEQIYSAISKSVEAGDKDIDNGIRT